MTDTNFASVKPHTSDAASQFIYSLQKVAMKPKKHNDILHILQKFECLNQGHRENFEAPRQKKTMRPVVSKGTKKFSRSTNQLPKNVAGLLYKAPWTFMYLMF